MNYYNRRQSITNSELGKRYTCLLNSKFKLSKKIKPYFRLVSTIIVFSVSIQR